MLTRLLGRRTSLDTRTRPHFCPRLGTLEPRNLLTTLYYNDFEGSVGAGWNVPVAPSITVAPSYPITATTSVTRGSFLGEFANDTATLTVPNVPAGSVTVSFDLYVLRTWDGVGIESGPDRFQVAIDGNSVLDTTFSLTAFVNNPQGYPGPATNYPANTGSIEQGTLGFDGVTGDYQQGPSAGSAVYRLTFTVPHASPGNLVVQFAGSGLQIASGSASDPGSLFNPDESWGLDNVWIATNTNRTKTIGWWQNPNGQNLMKNAPASVGNWLADQYPNLFGIDGLIIPNASSMSNTALAAYYKQTLFGARGQKTEAQVATAALNVYFYGPTQYTGTSGYVGILQPPFNTTLGNTYATNDILTMLRRLAKITYPICNEIVRWPQCPSTAIAKGLQETTGEPHAVLRHPPLSRGTPYPPWYEPSRGT